MIMVYLEYLFTLTKTTRSAYVREYSSIFGAIILHGPHHVAKKSTTTNLSPAFSSWSLKSAYNTKQWESEWEKDKCKLLFYFI